MRRDPLDLRRALARVAREQGGYFSAAQALKVGYSYPSQRYHTGRGDWLRVDRGIYRLPDWPASQHEDLARWTLWSRGRGVVSHETALDVHELGDVMPARVDLTVPPGFRSRSPAVRLHVAALGHGLATAGSLRATADRFGPAAALAVERALRQAGH